MIAQVLMSVGLGVAGIGGLLFVVGFVLEEVYLVKRSVSDLLVVVSLASILGGASIFALGLGFGIFAL